MILPDVNVLVYAERADFPQHARYLAWLEEALSGTEPVALVAPVIAGFLRVVTNPRIHAVPTPLDQAVAFVESMLASPQAVTPTPSTRLVPTFVGVCRRSAGKGDLVPDAYLAAIAIDIDAELITADRGFARFPGLRWRHPFGA